MSDVIVSLAEIKSQYDPTKNITRNVLSRYERAKIIGLRMEQLAREAISLVDTHDCKTVREIAMKELKEKRIPFMLARTLANGKKEYWKIEDLIV